MSSYYNLSLRWNESHLSVTVTLLHCSLSADWLPRLSDVVQKDIQKGISLHLKYNLPNLQKLNNYFSVFTKSELHFIKCTEIKKNT